MRVYLAEKPSQGREIVRALGGRGPGHPAKVPGGCVVWAIGHLLELAEPKDYDPRWARWDESTLPVIPPGPWRKRPAKGRESQLREVRRALDGADEIVICTDAGREGELIAREVIETTKAGRNGVPVLRMWTSALNPAALKAALSNLRPGSETEPLHRAAQVRERADWMEGMSLTRMFTLRCAPPGRRGVISAGRVQTPALALVVRRDREIEAFSAKDYFELAGSAVPPGLAMRHAPGQEARILDPAEAERRRAAAEGAEGPLRCRSEPRRRAPPAPYDLAALQSAAAARRGWSAKRTLEVAQRLYERHKAISYPRTDGKAYDPTEWDSCMKALDRLPKALPALAPHVPPRAGRIRRASVFSAKRLEGRDHHALMPTSEAPGPGAMDADEAWLFEVVCRRFLAQFMPDWEFTLTTAEMDAGGVPFRAQARTTAQEGWKAVDAVPRRAKRAADGGDEEDELDAPEASAESLVDGMASTMRDVRIESKRTRAPARHTEGSLVKAMQRAGIGTQATWAQVIETLKARGYVLAKGRRLESTPGGRAFVGIAERHVPELPEPESTARLERILDEVASGARDPDDAERVFRERVSAAVEALRGQDLGQVALDPPGGSRPSRPSRSPRRGTKAGGSRRRGTKAAAPRRRRAK